MTGDQGGGAPPPHLGGAALRAAHFSCRSAVAPHPYAASCTLAGRCTTISALPASLPVVSTT